MQRVIASIILLLGMNCFATNRVEELLVWKISEELKLSIKQEKDIKRLIQDLNLKKAKSIEKIDSLIQQMAMINEDGAAKAKLKEYKTALESYNQISLEELSEVQKILPKVKTTKYFVVKSEISNKIKSLLVSTDRPYEKVLEKNKTEKVLLPDPKIIEE